MRLAMALICLPFAAGAQQFNLPEGCEGYLTVQQKGCFLSNHYICEQDDDGDQWRMDFGPNGAVYAARINFETEWVESFSLSSGDRRVLESAEDPANFTEMVETGVDTYDFVTRSDSGARRQWIGSDRVREGRQVIDGIELGIIDFESQLTDPETGEELYVGVGLNYFSEEWRLFLPGPQVTFFPDGEQVERDNSPVDFIFPGEPGFFATTPIYDCGVDTVRY